MTYPSILFPRSCWLPALAGLLLAGGAQAQERIYRCDNNVYTNTLQDPRAQGCKPMEGGNVTVVQGTRPATGQAPVKLASAAPTMSSGGPRVDAVDQKARDSDARQILESELKKAEARQVELTREYNNGEPEKLGPETRNNQKYLDRIAELKAAIARNDADIAGIRRELGRVTAAK